MALVSVFAGYSLLYAHGHRGSHHGEKAIAVAKAVSPSPSPTPVPEIVPRFEETVIADQIRKSSPTAATTVTTNANALDSHHVTDLQTVFGGLDGSDVEVAVFDNGPIRATHKEFRVDINNEATSRIKFRIQPPPNELPDFHATHVAGTMGAAGNTNKGRAKGMAPGLKTIYSENMRQDLEASLPSREGPTSRTIHTPQMQAGAKTAETRN